VEVDVYCYDGIMLSVVICKVKQWFDESVAWRLLVKVNGCYVVTVTSIT